MGGVVSVCVDAGRAVLTRGTVLKRESTVAVPCDAIHPGDFGLGSDKRVTCPSDGGVEGRHVWCPERSRSQASVRRDSGHLLRGLRDL